MINRLSRALLGKKRGRTSAIEPAELIMRFIENEAATLEMLAEARKSDETYVVLTPTIGTTAQKNVGWFGGAPCLPDDVVWPEIDGEPLRFACQIDLSSVPNALWSGLGPRQGWLSVFFHPEDMRPKVLHVVGILKKRDGPGQADATWSWPRPYSYCPRIQDHSAQWRIAITEHVGDLPPPKGWRKGKAPGFPDPRLTEAPDLANPAFQPINEATLTALLESIADHLTARKRRIDDAFNRDICDDARAELVQLKGKIHASIEAFSHIRDELLPFTRVFEIERVKDLVCRLASIRTYDIEYAKNDEARCAVSNAVLTLSDMPKPSMGIWWYSSYARSLYQHALYIYTRSPEALPAELRERMEAIWRFEALHERGFMGHAPVGHVYTPHGPTTPNAVLLELPTSDLVGWGWGDLYSIVLFIRRDELARGDFENVTFEITN